MQRIGAGGPSDAQKEVVACSGRCDGGINAEHNSSINASQGEAGTPQEEGGHCVRIASEIDTTVLLQVIITALRPN